MRAATWKHKQPMAKKRLESQAVAFGDLKGSDLIVDVVYEGGTRKNAGDDPISKLLQCGNQGGFRYRGSVRDDAVQLCVLYSELSDPDWPDSLAVESGLFVYFGDNKRSGDIHATKRQGNAILRKAFDCLHSGRRESVPPFFIFTKGPKGRDVVFRGLAVPGAQSLAQTDDLVAIWKTSKEGTRYQNYRATFTILDVAVISRAWIEDLKRGAARTQRAPTPWLEWIATGKCNPLVAPRPRAHRTRQEQLPRTRTEEDILQRIVGYFKRHPEHEYAFERCAAEIAKLMDANIVLCDVTRPWRDGGRDAVGKYRIGIVESTTLVDFALEAKCKAVGIGSGVKEMSRLLSRLRHRQFGIFVTTSYVGEQAYKEIVEDAHPVVILSGGDISRILIRAGYNSESAVDSWLRANFSVQ